MLAENFGWDAVECYTAEPLAADADDEKRIRKAVKESKQLREDKKKKVKPSYKGRRLYRGPSSSNEQRHATERSSYASSPGFVTGKVNMARTTSQILFAAHDQDTSPEIPEQQTLGQLHLMDHSLEGSNNSLLPGEWEKDNFVNSINMKNSGVGLSDVLFLDVGKTGMNSCTIFKGRLRECISFSESIGANRWVLEVIREGYCLPFVDLPESMTFLNHQSAICEADFVAKEIDKLLQSGTLVEVEVQGLRVCNSLGVAFNNSEKPRLILDLRYVNKHLRSCKFQYEDIRTAANLFKRGDWFIMFDYVSGYHHVEIFPEHTTFLGW